MKIARHIQSLAQSASAYNYSEAMTKVLNTRCPGGMYKITNCPSRPMMKPITAARRIAVAQIICDKTKISIICPYSRCTYPSLCRRLRRRVDLECRIDRSWSPPSSDEALMLPTSVPHFPCTLPVELRMRARAHTAILPTTATWRRSLSPGTGWPRRIRQLLLGLAIRVDFVNITGRKRSCDAGFTSVSTKGSFSWEDYIRYNDIGGEGVGGSVPGKIL